MSGDRIDWPSGKPRDMLAAYVRWIEALEQADAGDKEPLIALLRSDALLGPDARDKIADFLSRHKITKRRGRPATPAYRRTPTEAKLHNHAALVRYWQKKGLSIEEAIRAALRDEKREEFERRDYEAVEPMPTPSDEELDEMVSDSEFDRLDALMRGRRGSSRRMNKRR
jgi:hypothetical protein